MVSRFRPPLSATSFAKYSETVIIPEVKGRVRRSIPSAIRADQGER